jgi:nitrite reductase/ring-hydroxylating ferredoxin subunit
MAMARQALSSRGIWMTRPAGSIDGMAGLHARIVARIIDAVSELKGPDAGRTLKDSGLEALHTVIQPADIGPIRDRVLDPLRDDLLKLAVGVGRSAMGWDDEFYVDDYLILRINLPYEVARKADFGAENPGIGRVSPQVRDLAKARRVTDPVYDPKSYHRGHPPAAWAHGPHLDSWAGHSKDGLNIWWAMCDVPAEASMVLYPQLAGADLPCDRRTLYLEGGTPLPAPTFAPLGAGEMLIFDPEILHGTHLNVTDRTRVALSMRLNAAKPSFDPGCFYAREFWRRASDLEAGAFDAVLHLKREDNLGPATPPSDKTRRSAGAVTLPAADDGPVARVGPSSMLAEGGRLTVALADRRILLLRHAGRLSAVNAACPHYGLDLADGGVDEAGVHCPGCAVAFDLETGRSACDSLTLETFPVGEDGEGIFLDLSGDRLPSS